MPYQDNGWNHCVKTSKYGIFSGLYFPVFELNTGKIRTWKTPYLDIFRAVNMRGRKNSAWLYQRWFSWKSFLFYLKMKIIPNSTLPAAIISWIFFSSCWGSSPNFASNKLLSPPSPPWNHQKTLGRENRN